MKVAVIVTTKKILLLIFILVVFLTINSVLPQCCLVVHCMTLSNLTANELPTAMLLSTERTNIASGIKETIVIPTIDPDKEAQRLYNEALQQFGITLKTMKEVCGEWESKYRCSCNGTPERPTLNCRGQQINRFPADFPETLIKLQVYFSNSFYRVSFIVIFLFLFLVQTFD